MAERDDERIHTEGDAVTGGRAGVRERLTGRRARAALGIAVAVVLVAFGVPAYLGNRSDFFSRVESMQAKYEPWAVSTHAEAGCADCHVPPRMLAQAAHRVRMIGVFYASLVSPSAGAGLFPRPTNDACLVCHSDLRTVSPKGDLKIPHRAHVTILEMDCVACHDYLVHEPNDKGTHVPTMAGCLSCHDGDTAKDACWACHTDKAAPETHRSDDWLVVHGDAEPDEVCLGCHQWREDWCVDCHSRRPQSHGADWRSVHGDRVAIHRGCEACHDGPFCVRCHGEVPRLNFDPALAPVR